MEEVIDKQQKVVNTLDQFCINLTDKYNNYRLDNIYGREREVDDVIRCLIRRKKNNVLLLGNAGVGKTSIINRIIEKISLYDVPVQLYDKVVYSLDTATIMADTKYRGQMEKRMNDILDDIKKRKNVILFIDEFHTTMQTGISNTSHNIADILKPHLVDNSIQLIATTTFDDYSAIEKETALNRRLHKITIEEPNNELCIDIINNCIDLYSKYHKVYYPTEIINKIPKLAKQYISNKYLPDSAFDIIDELGANIRYKNINTELYETSKELKNVDKEKIDIIKQSRWNDIEPFFEKKQILNSKIESIKNNIEPEDDYVTITEDDMLKVLSTMSNIPLDKIKEDGIDKINNLEAYLKHNLIGQDHSISYITKCIKRSIIGLNNPNKPIGVNLLQGVSGCGKTYLAQLIADYWYDSNLIRVDMSEYQDKISASGLIGTSPGYLGYEDGGYLTEAVRNNPYSVILLDEIEKAHKDVLNILLQVFDNGILTDGQGREVNFRNCLILMTSNLGAKDSERKLVGYGGGNIQKIEDTSLKAINNFFSPEFINRIDNIIVFNKLSKDDMINILDREIDKLNILLSNRDVKIILNDTMKSHLLLNGFDEKYGARILKRTIESVLIDALTEYLIDNLNYKGNISVSWKDKCIFKQRK